MRRSIVARFGILLAVVGLVTLTALPGGAGAALSSSSKAASASAGSSAKVASATSAPAASAQSHTNCVPSGNGNLGLTCTGTYSGNTAWDPWTLSNLPADKQPTVTVSQAKNLTDQGVRVSWSRFTPSLDFSNKSPNPGVYSNLPPAFEVSLFECKGANPDFSSLATVISDCYMLPVGWKDPDQTHFHGPINGQQVVTADAASPPSAALPPNALGPYSALWGYPDVTGGRQQPTVPGNPPAGKCPFRLVENPDNKSTSCYFNGGNPNDWTGAADFHVEAPTPRSKGGFFDCGPTKPCSLVVAPNWGGTPANGVNNSNSSPGGGNDYSSPGSTSTCNVHTARPQPSQGLPSDLISVGGTGVPAYGQPDFVSGSAPFSLSGQSRACWAADRIVIPLSFAPTPDLCPTKTPQFLAAGSPMMQLQVNQWTTSWCTGSGGLAVQYAVGAESNARDRFLAGAQVGGASTDMALVTLPADPSAQQGSKRKFTYAPLANSGTGIAFALDDVATGAQIDRMVLSPRLLAKLTTQSYTLRYGCTNGQPGQPPPGQTPQPGEYCDPAVLKNPYSVFDDQEFRSLNQDCRPVGQVAGYACGAHDANAAQGLVAYNDFPSDSTDISGLGAFLPTVLLPESDMTYDLTGMVGADSGATDFLHGKTDPWGMHVNNNYVGVSYPVPNFSVRDNGATNPGNPASTCAKNAPGNPDPLNCDNSVGFWNGTMNNSWNFQTDLDTIARDLATLKPTAQEPDLACPSPNTNTCNNPSSLINVGLPTQFTGLRGLTSQLDLGDIENYQFPAASIVNASGTPVAPSQASVLAAVKDMKTNPDGITQYYDFASTDKNAYPLSMTDYAMVPTCGLSKSEAAAIAEFLTRAGTTGQVQGQAPGQLGQGYYPLTAAQKAQTLKAAGEVKAQDCKSPPPDTTISGHPGVHTTSATGRPGGGTGAPGTGQPGSGPANGARTGSPAGAGASGAPAGQARTAAFGNKSPDSGLAGLLLLLAIIAGSVVLIGGPTAWVVTATGKWPVVARYTRPAWAWAPPAWTRLRTLRIWRP